MTLLTQSFPVNAFSVLASGASHYTPDISFGPSPAEFAFTAGQPSISTADEESRDRKQDSSTSQVLFFPRRSPSLSWNSRWWGSTETAPASFLEQDNPHGSFIQRPHVDLPNSKSSDVLLLSTPLTPYPQAKVEVTQVHPVISDALHVESRHSELTDDNDEVFFDARSGDENYEVGTCPLSNGVSVAMVTGALSDRDNLIKQGDVQQDKAQRPVAMICGQEHPILDVETHCREDDDDDSCSRITIGDYFVAAALPEFKHVGAFNDAGVIDCDLTCSPTLRDLEYTPANNLVQLHAEDKQVQVWKHRPSIRPRLAHMNPGLNRRIYPFVHTSAHREYKSSLSFGRRAAICHLNPCSRLPYSVPSSPSECRGTTDPLGLVTWQQTGIHESWSNYPVVVEAIPKSVPSLVPRTPQSWSSLPNFIESVDTPLSSPSLERRMVLLPKLDITESLTDMINWDLDPEIRIPMADGLNSDVDVVVMKTLSKVEDGSVDQANDSTYVETLMGFADTGVFEDDHGPRSALTETETETEDGEIVRDAGNPMEMDVDSFESLSTLSLSLSLSQSVSPGIEDEEGEDVELGFVSELGSPGVLVGGADFSRDSERVEGEGECGLGAHGGRRKEGEEWWDGEWNW